MGSKPSDRAFEKSGLPILSFAEELDLNQWFLAHLDAKGIWIRFPKKGANWGAINKQQALDVALCHGWIDGQAAPGNDESFLMRFTPRRQRSNWSKINCARAEVLIAQGRFYASGLSQVAAAKADGRWEAAYASPRTMVPPPELEEAFRRYPIAAEAFRALSKSKQHTVLLGIVTKKRPETRQRKIGELLTALCQAPNPSDRA